MGIAMTDEVAAALPLKAINMVGEFDLPHDGVVSSLALTPDGCYVFAALGGGEVRLYAQALGTVGAASRSGTIVAQIKSKGMFSSTKMDCHAEASEDGRFVFAGLLRGSSEMLALDITDLPRWETLPTKEEVSLAASRFDLNKCIRTYTHSEGKLKGFGAVAAVRTGPDRSEWGKEYRLFCGRGIKNIHVWSFKPEAEARGSSRVSRGKGHGGCGGLGKGEWACLYDTGTNGATVELVAFRNGGLEGISKSNDANVRVWDLSGEGRTTKPPFRDISNSKDTRIVFGDYAYGGTTSLSLVKLDAPAVANRMEIALPDAGVSSPLAVRGSPLAGRSSPSARGKRHCRMLKDLAGTQDGRHVVLVCSDGSVLYHRHTQAVNTMRLEPLEGVGVDEDDARPTVALSLAGRAGLPVLMIAGGRERGGAGSGDVESQKELVLKVLPRSDAQKLEDSQVTRLDSLGRPLLAWPEGRRLTPEDKMTELGDYDDHSKNAECGREETVRRNPIQEEEGAEAMEGGSIGEATIASPAATPDISKPDVVQSPPRKALTSPHAPATPSASSTPVTAAVAAAVTSTWQRLESKPDISPLPFEPPRSMSPSPSSSGTGPSRLFTPGSSGRKHDVHTDSGKASAPGSSPSAQSTVGPSPGEVGSRGGRKKRGSGGCAGHGRSHAYSDSSLAQAGAACDTSTERRLLGTGADDFSLDVVASPGKGASVGRRMGKKRSREDQDKGAEDESGSEEGETTTVPLKRGRRGTGPGEEGGASSRGTVGKTRRTISHGVDDEGGGGGLGNGDQVLLRDRRSRIAARALRSSGNVFDIGAIVKGMNTSWMNGAEQPEEIRVVRVEEQDVVVGPRAVSAGLFNSLSEREEKRNREKFSIPLERVRAQYNARFELLPPYPPVPTAVAAVGDGKPFISEAGKERGADKNHSRVWGSLQVSRNPHHAMSSHTAAGVEKRAPFALASAHNPQEQGGRIAATAAVTAGNGVSVEKNGRDGNGEPRADATLAGAIADGIPAPNPFPQSMFELTPGSGGSSHDNRVRGDARDATVPCKNSQSSRLAGWRGVGEYSDARLAPTASQFDRISGPSSILPCSERSFVVPTAAKSGFSTGMVASELQASVSSKGSNLVPTRTNAQSLGQATSSSSPSWGSFAGELRAVDPEAGVATTNKSFSAENASSVSGGGRKLAKLPSAGATEATAGNSAASHCEAETLDVDTNLEVEVDSEADIVDDCGDYNQAKVHAGESAKRFVGYDSSAISKDDRVPPSEISGTIGPSSSGNKRTTVGSVDVVDANATTNVAAVLEGRKGQNPQDIGKGKTVAFGSGAAEHPIVESSRNVVGAANVTTSGAHKLSKRGGKPAAAITVTAAVAPVGTSVFPPPQEFVIDMGLEGERGNGGGIIDRLYGEHCLEREVVAKVFFNEQDALRRRFLAAVDLVEVDKAVECSGMLLLNGCRAAQTLKTRLKTRWREATVLPVGGGGLSRCTAREAQQATLRWQDQIRVIIAEYKELLHDLLGRQKLEAGTLQMAQEMELSKGKAPPLTVRFAFPKIFDEVAQRHGIKL